VPDHLVIAGGGYIGLELGSLWQRLGSQVTIIEMLPQILPTMDRQVADSLYKLLRKQGLQFKLGTRITGVRRIGAKAIIQFNDGTGSQEFDCDRLLVAVGRRPSTGGLGLEELGVLLDDRGRVVVDGNYQTSVPGIYAIGDLIAGPMLAHKASSEGTVCVERINKQQTAVEYELIPSVCYTTPEAAAAGKTEEQLQEEGIPCKTGRSSFAASGRARCLDATDGFVKIVAHAATGRVLGVHILGPHASELIAEAVSVISFCGTVRDIALTCHAHPTLSEALREAALDALGQGVHG
jgi:dihydrolipoamide dehydrogenase